MARTTRRDPSTNRKPAPSWQRENEPRWMMIERLRFGGPIQY